MNYYLYKMHFTTPLHIGGSDNARSLESSAFEVGADTLFSALCHMALLHGGAEEIDRLYRAAESSAVRFSDLFPFKANNLYIPKPYVIVESKREISSDERKKMKKLTHLPLSELSAFITSVQGGEAFRIDRIDNDFGKHGVFAKVAITGLEETEPYNVGFFDFNDDSGLYGVIAYEQAEDLALVRPLLTMLSYHGIGGKVSAGYGKFALTEVEKTDSQRMILENLLDQEKEGLSYISIASALPKEEELEEAVHDAVYQLVRRGGFIASARYQEQNRKKHTQHFFKSGSVFAKKFEGDIYDVGTGSGSHKVYRYGKPMFLGVKI